MAAVSITDVVISGNAGGPVQSGPLSPLYATQSLTGSTYRYPADLGTSSGKNAKNHWVTFTIYDVEPAGYNNPPNTIKLDTAAGKIAGGITGVAQTIGGINQLVQGNIAAATGSIAAAAVTTTLLTNGLTIKNQISDIKSTISLYMPDTLAQDYSASYDEMNLTDLGPAVTTLRAINSLANENGMSIDSMTSLGNNIGVDKYAILAAQQLGSAGGVNLQNVGDVMLKAQGLAINPQVQMIYRGTGLRSFQLTFMFTPKSQSEAQVVNSIINQFRFYAAPSLSSPSDPTNSMFLVPPSQFGIQFYVNGTESNVLPKYGQCVLTSMDVNNTPNGFAAYEDGSMVQTQLNLSFKELDILTRDYFVGSVASQTGGQDIRR
jgi:hypothetical protein